MSGASPDGILMRCGPPPSPTIVTFNPAYDVWIERAALMLCDHPEQDRVCRPCLDHLHEARDIAASVRPMSDTPPPPGSTSVRCCGEFLPDPALWRRHVRWECGQCGRYWQLASWPAATQTSYGYWVEAGGPRSLMSRIAEVKP